MLLGKHPPTTFHLFNSPLPNVTVFRDLGVTYTNTLSFQPHINNIISSARARSNYIFRAFISRSPKLYASLFNTYIRPILEFSCELWNPTTSLLTTSIENVQREYTRRVFTRCLLGTASYSDRLCYLGLVPLNIRRAAIDLSLIYKIKHNMIELPDDFLARPASNRFSLRRRNNFTIRSRSTTTRGCSFISNRVAKIWNRIPQNITNYTSPSSFKNAIISFATQYLHPQLS